jgi:hypothetical protein
MAVRLFVSKVDGAIFSFLGGFVQRFLKDALDKLIPFMPFGFGQESL